MVYGIRIQKLHIHRNTISILVILKDSRSWIWEFNVPSKPFTEIDSHLPSKSRRDILLLTSPAHTDPDRMVSFRNPQEQGSCGFHRPDRLVIKNDRQIFGISIDGYFRVPSRPVVLFADVFIEKGTNAGATAVAFSLFGWAIQPAVIIPPTVKKSAVIMILLGMFSPSSSPKFIYFPFYPLTRQLKYFYYVFVNMLTF